MRLPRIFRKDPPIEDRLDRYTLAYCPHCHRHVSVYRRLGDDLICLDCANRGVPFDVTFEDQERGL